MQKLQAMRRGADADPVADAETQALHRATQEIRDGIAAKVEAIHAQADEPAPERGRPGCG
jgi:hypothetical protein